MKTPKLVAIVLLFFALVSMVPGHSSAQVTFTDVTSKDEFYKELDYLAGKKIISGYENGSLFKPYNHLTKAQAAKMLVIATNKQNIPLPPLKFAAEDRISAEQYEYISRAVSLGYFKVGTDKRFSPNEKIKRDDMAYGLSVAFNLSEKITAAKPLRLNDVKDNNYKEHINGLYYAGVTQGDNGKFLPDNNLSRKHFVLLVARAMNPSFSIPVKQPVETAGTSYVKVNTGSDSLNIRATASDKASILGKLSHGNVVEVLGKTGDWLQIRTNNIVGYVHAYFTEPAGTQTPSDNVPVKPKDPVAVSGLTGKVTADSLNVRSSASTTSSILYTLKRGQQVEVIKLDGYWATIKFNSKIGFVHKTYLKLLNESNSPLKDRIIVVDAGHGGSDPGASSKGLVEKTVALDVSKRVEAKLIKAGAKVLMTRSGDTFPSLKNRTDYAKNNFAETFVSIHLNAATPAAKGAEVFYDSSGNPNGEESRLLAEYIQNNIVKQAGMVNRGVKNKGFYVIKNNNVASVLVELGFLTNADDAKKLSNSKYLEIYAEAIYQGLVQYYSAK